MGIIGKNYYACGGNPMVHPQMKPLYHLKEGNPCEKTNYGGTRIRFTGGKPADGNILSSVGLQKGTKNGKPYERLVFRESGGAINFEGPLTPCKKLGSFKVDYCDQQDDGEKCIRVTLGGIRAGRRPNDEVSQEQLNELVKDSLMIGKIKFWNEGMRDTVGDYGDDQSITLLITLSRYHGPFYKPEVYEVPEQGKMIIDLPQIRLCEDA